MSISKKPSQTVTLRHVYRSPRTIQTTLHEQEPVRRLLRLKNVRMIRGTRDVERLGSTDWDRRISRSKRKATI